MKQLKYIVAGIFLLTSCNKNLYKQINQIGEMKNIDVQQLTSWSNKKGLDKLSKNQEIRYETTDQGSFTLIEQNLDKTTIIKVSKMKDSINGISTEIINSKDENIEKINYYLNGSIHRRINKFQRREIRNSILGKITVDNYYNKIETFDKDGKHLLGIDFNQLYTFKLTSLLIILENMSNVKDPFISMVIPNESLMPREFLVNKMLNENSHIDLSLPYWDVTYRIPGTENYRCLLFNGKTGSLVAEKTYKMSTALDYKIPTPIESLEIKATKLNEIDYEDKNKNAK